MLASLDQLHCSKHFVCNVSFNLHNKPEECKAVLLVAKTVNNLPAMQETCVWFLGREDPWRREWQPTPVFLPREFHGQRNLVGYSPLGLKESDMIERLTLLILFNWKSIFPLIHLTKYIKLFIMVYGLYFEMLSI